MLHTLIRKNQYQDSVSLMMLSTQLSGLDEVNRVSIMMGTPANKEIFWETGFGSNDLDAADAGDMVIVVDADDAAALDLVDGKISEFLSDQKSASSGKSYPRVRSLERALSEVPDANLALVSIPGEQAAPEINRLIEAGLHVFVFSDNISVEDEVALKSKARENGLLMMGPDCGTGSLGGIPLAFTNVVRKGSIGIVGASGTGTQEVMSQVDRIGGGISQAIGLGGRDLSESVGAITCLQALDALESDPETHVIVLVSKPPAKDVRKKVMDHCERLSKPVVAILLGELPEAAEDSNVTFAANLADAAKIAVSLSGSKPADQPEFSETQRKLTGLFCGGTLANEAAIVASRAFGLPLDADHPAGYMLHHDGHTIIDLGDDKYTQGRPHPMIDPTLRGQMIREAFENPELAVLLLDVVTGYGSHPDPAGAAAEAIQAGRAVAEEQGRHVVVVANICGTEQDPQPLSEQTEKLESAGVVVLDSNIEATTYALNVIDGIGREDSSSDARDVPESTLDLVTTTPRIINMGLPSFAEAIHETGGEVVQYTWSPLAGGNKKLQKILAALA